MNRNDIKVGDYVRTNEGYIAQFITYGFNRGINGKSCLFDRQIRDIDDLIYDDNTFLFDNELEKYIKKTTKCIIDLLEDTDLVVIKYYVPKYRERIARTFIVNKIGSYITFENCHCTFNLKYDNNKWKWLDSKGYNPKIISILTKEMFKNKEYLVYGDK